MGVDLILLPFDGDIPGVLCFSQTVLPVPRNRKLFEEIEQLPNTKVPKGFTSYLSRDDEYEEPHYGDTTINPYGEPVVYVLAGWLKKVGLLGATGAYINALDDSAKVALYWC